MSKKINKKIPSHIAIIMDGNRRWARKKGLPTFFGHKKGYDKFREIGEACLERGVKILTVYAFSTENWNRSKKEVNYLMTLLKNAITIHSKELHKKNIKLQILGQTAKLPKGLQKSIKKALDLTKGNTAGVLNIALNYGGRTEIVDAVKSIVKKRIPFDEIDDKKFEENLYTDGLPDPDLLIRTGGEQRLSNFLPWQLTYAELYFVNKYWPDFGVSDLDAAILEFQDRERRFGH